MSELYSTLPPKTYTLAEFIQHSKYLEQQPDNAAFTRFVLTGEADDHQAVLDPLRNALPDGHPIQVYRDYDSALNIHDRIIVDASISVHPIPNPTHTLTTSIHIKLPITRGDVSRNIVLLPIDLTCHLADNTFHTGSPNP
jgi:hypothetical protein